MIMWKNQSCIAKLKMKNPLWFRIGHVAFSAAHIPRHIIFYYRIHLMVITHCMADGYIFLFMCRCINANRFRFTFCWARRFCIVFEGFFFCSFYFISFSFLLFLKKVRWFGTSDNRIETNFWPIYSVTMPTKGKFHSNAMFELAVIFSFDSIHLLLISGSL